MAAAFVWSRCLPAFLWLAAASWCLAAAATPSCRFRADAGWQPCAYFNLSCYCCLGGLQFATPLRSAVIQVGDDPQRGPPRAANVTFNATTDGRTAFLVGRAEGCSAAADCYDVVPSHTVFGDVQVELAFLPWDEARAVSRLDHGDLTRWISNTADRSSEESAFLHASVLILDLVGADAHLKLFAPLDAAEVPATMSSACVTLYSGRQHFPCANCTCRYDTRGTDIVKRSLCVERPYDGDVLDVKNATGFFNGTHAFPFHWAVIRIGGSCLRSSQLVVPPPRLEFPPLPVGRVSLTLEISLTAAFAVAAAVVLLAIVLKFVKLRRAGSKTSAPHSEPLDEQPLNGGTSKLVVLYRRNHQNGPCEAMQRLIEIIRLSDGVEVLDPYEGAALIESGPVQTAQDFLSDPSVFVLMYATEEVMKARRYCGDIFDQFLAVAKGIIEESPNHFGPGHILTAITNADLTLFQPWNRMVYFLPDRIETLLRDIPGAPTGDDFREQIEEYQNRFM